MVVLFEYNFVVSNYLPGVSRLINSNLPDRTSRRPIARYANEKSRFSLICWVKRLQHNMNLVHAAISKTIPGN